MSGTGVLTPAAELLASIAGEFALIAGEFAPIAELRPQITGEFARGAAPSWLVPVFHAITRLGNVAVFLVVFALDYWFVDRERGAHAMGLVIAGMALITLLKSLFAQPRPPPSVNAIPISGYSFPSGHATGATIAYGTLAFDLDIGTRRVRYGVAALLVALVAASRVVLGVHFLRDVAAGVGFGLAFLAVAFALTGHAPDRGFVLAVGVAALSLVVAGPTRDTAAVLGAAVGAAAVWTVVDSAPPVESLRWRVALVGGVLPALAGIGYVVVRLGPPLVAVFALTAVLTATIVGAPSAVARLERG